VIPQTVARTHRERLPTIDLVQETWAEILGLDAVGPDDDFFELGGNSLNVASAVARLGERLGIQLPLRALFHAPTPAEMSELIEERQVVQEPGPGEGTDRLLPEWVVPVQREGTGRPVFLFPGGEFGLKSLARDAQIVAHVGRDHPFWGIRLDHPFFADDRERENPVPLIAAAYVRQMRRIQPQGPYLLYGICGGGLLTWEAAKQLIAAGETIAGILFYEVPLSERLFALPDGYSPAQTTSWWRPFPNPPRPLPVHLTLLMTETWHDRRDSVLWTGLAEGGGATIVMPGGRHDRHVLYDGYEELIARHVRTWMERAEARARG
jgi:acyl carrier protein